MGVKYAKGEILIFVDDDTQFDENFVNEHSVMHQQGYAVVQRRII